MKSENAPREMNAILMHCIVMILFNTFKLYTFINIKQWTRHVWSVTDYIIIQTQGCLFVTNMTWKKNQWKKSIPLKKNLH